jgi:hypothetical protein
MDYVTANEKRFTGGHVRNTIKASKSWLNFNDLQIRKKIKIRNPDETPTLRNERVPTPEELERILLSASKQSRVAVVLIAHGGLRPESLGDYRGQDGLTLGDFPELRFTSDCVKFEAIPTILLVRSNLSKARHQYFTFLGAEGCQYLQDYLNERLRQALYKCASCGNESSTAGMCCGGPMQKIPEKLTVDSPLLRSKIRTTKRFIRTSNVGDLVRSAIRRAGFPWRPYVLRCFFDTQLMLAESKGLVVRDYRSFWMGHKGDIENRYTTNKHRLPQDVVDDMRDAYKRSQSLLQTRKNEFGEKEIRVAFKRELLLAVGYTENEVSKLDLTSMPNDRLHSLLKQRLLGVMTGNGQRVIPLGSVEDYVQKGWEFVAALPDDRAVIKLPV